MAGIVSGLLALNSLKESFSETLNPHFMGYAMNGNLEGFKGKLKAKPDKAYKLYMHSDAVQVGPRAGQGGQKGGWEEGKHGLKGARGRMIQSFPVMYHLMFMDCDIAFADALLESGWELEQGCPLEYPSGIVNQPWLCIAARLKNLTYIKWLIDHGANDYADATWGFNVFHNLAWKNEMEYGAQVLSIADQKDLYRGERTNECFEYFMQHPAIKEFATKPAAPYDANADYFHTGRTPAVEVCCRLATEFDNEKEKVTISTSRVTVPHWMPMLKALLEAGTDPNALCGNKKLFAGANGMADGTLFHNLAMASGGYMTRNPADGAPFCPQILEACKLLKKHGADLNLLNADGQSALYFLICMDDPELLKWALTEGAASPSFPEQCSSTCAMSHIVPAAAFHCYEMMKPEVVRMLVQKCNLDINAQGK